MTNDQGPRTNDQGPGSRNDMTTATTILVLIFVASIFAYVAWPIIWDAERRTDVATRRAGRERADRLFELQVQKNAVYASLAELDLDHDTGKMSDDDYARQRDVFRQRAVA